jgi:hypothetical protein
MDIQSTLFLQIIADIILCLVIVYLLFRLRGNLNKKEAIVIDDKSLLQFRQLLEESQADGERLFRTIDESYRKFYELAQNLEVHEEKLRALVEEIKGKTETLDLTGYTGGHDSKEQYEPIIKLLKEGIAFDEIAVRTGITSGEISLIADLERMRQMKNKSR